MTAPERVTDEIVDIAHANYGLAMGAVKPGEGVVTHRECLRAAIRAVAPLIRAEGYKQGVEDAAKVADGYAQKAKDRWPDVPAHVMTWLETVASAIRALPNQPDASEGHET